MLKKIMVTPTILILFLFSISFLPLTQITEAEAQFSNKIQKQLSNKIPKQRSLSKAIKKPTPGKLTDKEKKKFLGKRLEWSFDTPMEKLIAKINSQVREESHAANRINQIQTHTTDHFQRELRDITQFNIGCNAPSMYGTRTKKRFCGDLTSYREMLHSDWEAPFILSYRTHKQLLHCNVPIADIDIYYSGVWDGGTGPWIDIGGCRRDHPVSGHSIEICDQEHDRETPLSVTLRSMGTDFGKCFCKFGSRQGTHPSAGYENIVPHDFSDVCPL